MPHTPGPWRLGSTGRVILAGLGRRIATTPQYAATEAEADENGHNARLIIAAPELFEILGDILDKCHRALPDEVYNKAAELMMRIHGTLS